VARHMNSGVKAYGVSNALRARGLTRSEELSRSRKDHRMSAGYQVAQLDDDSVRIRHHLGNGHRITLAADRAAKVEAELTKYTEILENGYAVVHHGEGEQAYLIVRNPVSPLVGETLRKAAKLVRELPGSAARTANAAIVAEHLEGWATLADGGKGW